MLEENTLFSLTESEVYQFQWDYFNYFGSNINEADPSNYNAGDWLYTMKILPTNGERDPEGLWSTLTLGDWPEKGWLANCWADPNDPDNCASWGSHRGMYRSFEYDTSANIFFWYVTTDVLDPISESMDAYMY